MEKYSIYYNEVTNLIEISNLNGVIKEVLKNTIPNCITHLNGVKIPISTFIENDITISDLKNKLDIYETKLTNLEKELK